VGVGRVEGGLRRILGKESDQAAMLRLAREAYENRRDTGLRTGLIWHGPSQRNRPCTIQGGGLNDS